MGERSADERWVAEPVTAVVGTLLESPTWDAGAGRLVFDDAPSGRLLAVDPRRAEVVDVRAEIGSLVGCVVLAAEGGLVAAAADGVHTVGPDGAPIQRIDLPPSDEPDWCCNDGKVDRHGRLWFGTTTAARRPLAGSLHRLDPGATSAATVAAGFTLSNGLDWSPDGYTLYHADSFQGTVVRHRLDDAAQVIVDTAPFVNIDPADGAPDGLAVDVDGFAWVAVWAAGEVRRYAPDGTQVGVVEIATPNVTSCCFGGPQLDQLFVTTAGRRDGTVDPLAGALFVADVGIAGRPATPFGAGEADTAVSTSPGRR